VIALDVLKWSYSRSDARPTSILLLSNLVRDRKLNKKKTYSTRQAALKVGISLRSLNRWLARGLLRPAIAVPMDGERTLWRWTETDLSKARKVKAAQRPGPKTGD
jgi:hypothetical protein